MAQSAIGLCHHWLKIYCPLFDTKFYLTDADLLYPPNNEVVGGYIGFTLSVCPSVRPSVPPAVSAL